MTDASRRAQHFWTVVRVLLIPLVQVACYQYFGFSGFCVSVLAFWIVNQLVQFALGHRPFQVIGGWIWLMVPAFFSVAWFKSDPVIVKTLPTFLGCSFLLLGSLLLWPNHPAWATISRGFEKFSGRTQMASLASVAILVVANEIIRANASTEAWVWFYAFIMLEATFGVLIILLLIGGLRALLTAIADAFGLP